jgi:hypothetical protein
LQLFPCGQSGFSAVVVEVAVVEVVTSAFLRFGGIRKSRKSNCQTLFCAACAKVPLMMLVLIVGLVAYGRCFSYAPGGAFTANWDYASGDPASLTFTMATANTNGWIGIGL